jgi:hypothetical protein
MEEPMEPNRWPTFTLSNCLQRTFLLGTKQSGSPLPLLPRHNAATPPAHDCYNVDVVPELSVGDWIDFIREPSSW